MKRWKYTVCAGVITMFTLTAMVGCNNKGSDKNNNTASPDEKNTEEGTLYTLRFSEDDYVRETMKVDGKDVTFRVYKDMIYVQKPVDEMHERMNIYIPEAYYNGESIGSYNFDNAPILLQNNIGGYLPSEAAVPSMDGKIEGDALRLGLRSDKKSAGKENDKESPNSVLLALSKGYVVAAPATRGRTSKSVDGTTYTGKAPAAIVDLKAAVRYLHYNDELMPGDANRILSNGSGAGGALSALLGASGNSNDYMDYLKELGAAETSDVIYAVSAYCPMTNMEHADMAYEWMFGDPADTMLNKEELAYSKELKELFESYLASLELTVEDNADLLENDAGEGSLKQYLVNCIKDSAQKALDRGVDLTPYKWLTVKKKQVAAVDFKGYTDYVGRNKVCPAFDAINLSRAENGLFGTMDVDAMHFTEFSKDRDKNGGKMADTKIIKLMNPMDYIGVNDTETALHYRIRHGAKDSDTAVVIPALLALKLKEAKCDVDFAIAWGEGHGGDYDLGELFAWMDEKM